MMDNLVACQLASIKSHIVSILTYQKGRLTVQEKGLLHKLYEFLDDVFCERATHKRFTVEEHIDNVIMESSLILKNSRNDELKKLRKALEKGIKW